ncbi:TPA: hypothetical protein SLG40_002156 [Serratia odorifera]|nr:hypothetical protein [Serratia odorifera]
MNKKEELKKKMALHKAKAFLKKINGINNIDIVESNMLISDAQREKQKEIFRYDSGLEPQSYFSLENSSDAIVQWQTDCLKSIVGKSLFFEVNDYFCAKLNVTDIYCFLKCLYIESGNRDLVLFVDSPSKILAFNDNEYRIYFYDVLV